MINNYWMWAKNLKSKIQNVAAESYQKYLVMISTMETTGIEPVTSCLQSRRSPS